MIEVTDISNNTTKTVKDYNEVIKHLVRCTNNLFIPVKLTSEEITKIKELENNPGDLTVLDRFKIRRS